MDQKKTQGKLPVKNYVGYAMGDMGLPVKRMR